MKKLVLLILVVMSLLLLVKMNSGATATLEHEILYCN